jgi:uncharacterized protein
MAAFAVGVGVILGYGARLVTAPVVTKLVAPVPSATPQPMPLVTADQYPLTIPAQRARRYPGGEIKVEEELGDQGGYRLSRISYPSDGYRIYGLMAMPTTSRPVLGYPVVLLVHGFMPPDAYRTTGPEYMPYMQALANHGYAVIKPDLRGHGQSWGLARGAYFSPDYNADILNLAASLRTHRALNPQAVGLFGHSMGGNVVLDSLVIAPQRFRGVIIASGAVGNMDDMFYRWRPSSEAGAPAAQIERQRVVKLFGGPRDQPEFWRTVSPLNYAASLTMPVQLHHGLADAVVPAGFSRQLAAALTAVDRTPQLHEYAGVGHTYAGASQALLLERSLAFLDQTLLR